MTKKSLKEALGWGADKNPFTLELVTDVVVGHKRLYNELYERLERNKRMILVSGPYGAGKSFTLTYLRDNTPRDAVFVYLTGDYMRNEVTRNIVATRHELDPFVTRRKYFGLVTEKVRMPVPDIPENMLADFVNTKLGQRKLVFIWDDIQRVKNADLVGICVVLFEHTNSCIILCGLKEGIGWMENEISFLNRGMDSLEPEPLAKEELKELIRRRVEWVGGQGFRPFTEEAVEYLATRFSGARDLLNICGDVLVAMEKEFAETQKVPMADMAYIENLLKDRLEKSPEKPEITPEKDVRKKFSKLELTIFEMLLASESKTSPQLVDELKKDRGTIAKTIERMMDKHPGIILIEKVDGKRRPENSYRVIEDIKRQYAVR